MIKPKNQRGLSAGRIAHHQQSNNIRSFRPHLKWTGLSELPFCCHFSSQCVCKTKVFTTNNVTQSQESRRMEYLVNDPRLYLANLHRVPKVCLCCSSLPPPEVGRACYRIYQLLFNGSDSRILIYTTEYPRVIARRSRLISIFLVGAPAQFNPEQD